MTGAKLWFPRTDVLDLAEHAMAAAEHSLPPFDNTGVGSPSLIWVKDDGIYLASNGLPRQARTEADHPDSKMHVVYAHGHGYGAHWHHGPPLGDDFVEYLPLTESLGEDGAAFIDTLRGPDTAAWLVITVYPNTFSVELSDIGPS
ncbi:hypothetical protein ACTD5D_02085 [Nocardia takedensis]|uniref:hypothetical protein n=2 Tax=Nocardiaceae TaxID=85025 RepID=UPI002458762B|nr:MULTISPECIES: hypothetical protein [Nocardia]